MVGSNGPAPAGPGVTFTYPANGQRDVPTGAQLSVRFSHPVDARAVESGCSISGGVVDGAVCLESEGELVGIQAVTRGALVSLAPIGGLLPGVTYRLHVGKAALPDATNLPEAGKPLVTFQTRQLRTVAGEAPRLLTINDAAADGEIPVFDVSPLRLLFSEPLDPATVTATTARVVRIDAQGTQLFLPALVLADGVHVTVDPDEDLDTSFSYRLRLSGEVKDLGGEPLAPLDVELHPQRVLLQDGSLREQLLAVDPPWEPGRADVESSLSRLPANTNLAASPLIGETPLRMLAGGLKAQLGDTRALAHGAFPMIIRRGQRLDMSPMSIRFGGVVDSGKSTGTLHLTVLTDAVGTLSRNPLRSPDQVPDDNSPIYVDLTMDAALSAEDANGNAMSTQTVTGLRLLGLSTAEGDQLVVEQVGALELSTLGINRAAVNLALRLKTGALPDRPQLPAPKLTAVFPEIGATGVSADERILLTFSSPIALTRQQIDSALALLENNTAIGFNAWTVGSTLIVQPVRHWTPGAQIALTFNGLQSLDGQKVVLESGGPTFGQPRINFRVAPAISQRDTPPLVTSSFPGVPCALIRTSAISGGACVGGLENDTTYLPFELEADREVRVTFNQPIDPATLVLGTACGKGSVRVEALAANGRCSVVRGTLLAGEQDVRFLPAQPWTPGTTYRVVLVGGPDGMCGAGEICSRGGLPLNTDPLVGLASSTGGGPDLELRFVGARASPDSFQPLRAAPSTDINGNGRVDVGEELRDENRVAMEIVTTSGIISSATLDGPDCVKTREGQQACNYLQADLPVSVGEAVASCPVDGNGRPAQNAPPCIRVRTQPSLLIGTSMTMSTRVLLAVPFNGLETGPLVMRTRQTGGIPAYGYILREPGDSEPQFVLNQDIYLDAPNLEIVGGVASHDLHSKPISMTLKGPVTFLPDGRMQVALRNLRDVPLTVTISAALLSGNIDMRIPAGEMRLTLRGPHLR